MLTRLMDAPVEIPGTKGTTSVQFTTSAPIFLVLIPFCYEICPVFHLVSLDPEYDRHLKLSKRRTSVYLNLNLLGICLLLRPLHPSRF